MTTGKQFTKIGVERQVKSTVAEIASYEGRSMAAQIQRWAQEWVRVNGKPWEVEKATSLDMHKRVTKNGGGK